MRATLGKQQVVWGRTDLFRVLDVINPVDYSRNNIYDELQDIRIPMWIAQGEWRMGASESMQERKVSVGGTDYALPEPFFVLATQNPIEQEGTYPLPEAQLDRFMFHILMEHPPEDEELEVVRLWQTGFSSRRLDAVDLVPLPDPAVVTQCRAAVRVPAVPGGQDLWVLRVPEVRARAAGRRGLHPVGVNARLSGSGSRG